MGTRVFIAKGTTDLSTASLADTNEPVLAEGGQAITAGTDFSALTDGFDAFTVQQSFSGSIVNLRCDINTGGVFLYQAGGGSLSYEPKGNDDLCPRFRHIGAGSVTLQTGGTVTNYEQGSGTGTITEDVTVTNLYLAGGNLTQAYKSTANTILIVSGGSLQTGRPFTTGTVTNGTVTVRRTDTSSTVPAATTLNLYGPNSRVIWNGGNIGTLNLYGGASIDFSNAPVDLTVTTINADLASIRRSVWESNTATLTLPTPTVRAAVRDALTA